MVCRYTPVLNGIPYFCIPKRATDLSWLLPGPAVQMGLEKVDGTPKLLEGVPAPVPLRLYGETLLLIIQRRISKKSLYEQASA